jgi:hypothetical protein
VQVEQRQYLVDLRGLAAPGGQDCRGEPLTLTLLVEAFVVDPRRRDLDGSGAGQHLTRPSVTITHHQPAAVVVQLAGMRGDVGGNLRLQRGREHPPGAGTHNLIDQRPAGRGRLGHGRWRGFFRVHYRKHGRALPGPRWRAGSTRFLDIERRREGTPLDAHPQVSSIAQCLVEGSMAFRCRRARRVTNGSVGYWNCLNAWRFCQCGRWCL